jgi:hypothetical protein
VIPRAVFASLAFGGSALVAAWVASKGKTSADPVVQAIIALVVMPLPLLAGLAAEWSSDRSRFQERLRLSPGSAGPLATTSVAFATLIAGFYATFMGVAEAVGLEAAGHLARTGQELFASLPELGGEPTSDLEIPPLGFMWVAAVATAAFAGCTLNALLAFGEEYGWRGFMLEDLGDDWRGDLALGAVWGAWHAPWIALGHNYGAFGLSGLPSMMLFCAACSTAFRRLSPPVGRVLWASVLHGTINGLAGFLVVVTIGGDPRISGPAPGRPAGGEWGDGRPKPPTWRTTPAIRR